MERLDIIVFGATGYTGSFLVRELATTFKNEKISWGIAGRSGKRLNDLLKSVSMEENSNFIYSCIVSILWRTACESVLTSKYTSFRCEW